MAKARYIVRTDALCLEPQMLIETALKLMRQKNMTSAPVLNSDDTIAGILAESDIIRMFIAPENGGKEGKTVSDFMTKDVTTEEIESDIGRISRCLLNNHFEQVPIVHNGKFVGVVSRKDLLRFMIEPVG